MTSKSQANRRGSQRLKPRGTVKLECRKGALGLGANVVDSFLDLSQGGCRFISKAALEPKSEVEVMLNAFGLGKSIKRLANVAWIVAMENGKFCVGLQFQKTIDYRDCATMATS